MLTVIDISTCHGEFKTINQFLKSRLKNQKNHENDGTLLAINYSTAQ